MEATVAVETAAPVRRVRAVTTASVAVCPIALERPAAMMAAVEAAGAATRPIRASRGSAFVSQIVDSKSAATTAAAEHAGRVMPAHPANKESVRRVPACQTVAR